MKKYLPIFLLGVLTFLTYTPLLQSDFKIDENGFRPGGNFSHKYTSATDFFTKLDSKHYYPLYYLLNYSLHHIFPENAMAMRLVNICLFVVIGLLLYIFTLKLTKTPSIAFLSSLFFLIHPINADHLGHINIINTLFSGMLYLSIFLLIMRCVDNGRQGLLFSLSLVLYALALLCGESGLLFPLYLFLLLKMALRQSWKKSFQRCLPFILMAGIYFGLWCAFVNPIQYLFSGVDRMSVSFVQYAASMSSLLFWYIGNLFYPNHIFLIYNLSPLESGGVVSIILGGGGMIGLLLYLWKIREYQNVTFLALWFLAGFLYLLPASFAHAYMGFVIEPHWFFFPTMGFFVCLGVLFVTFKPYMNVKLWACLVVLFASFLWIRTHEQNFKSRNDLSYAYYWMKHTKNNLPARLIVASYIEDGSYADVDPGIVPEMLNLLNFFITAESHTRAINLAKGLARQSFLDQRSREALYLIVIDQERMQKKNR